MCVLISILGTSKGYSFGFEKKQHADALSIPTVYIFIDNIHNGPKTELCGTP